MKLRYYLRGLGTGIIVTALILSRLTGTARPLTDAEIRAKALTLGMVDADSVSLSDVSDGHHQTAGTENETGSPAPGETLEPTGTSGPEETSEPGVTSGPEGTLEPEGTSEPEDTSEPGGTSEPKATSKPGGTSEPEDTSEPEGTSEPGETPEQENTSEPEGTSDSEETVTIVISRGDSSYTVSKLLEEAGLIEDAREFDAYLVESGHSRTVRTGTYQIPVNASWEEIADIIS